MHTVLLLATDPHHDWVRVVCDCGWQSPWHTNAADAAHDGAEHWHGAHRAPTPEASTDAA